MTADTKSRSDSTTSHVMLKERQGHLCLKQDEPGVRRGQHMGRATGSYERGKPGGQGVISKTMGSISHSFWVL